MVNEVLEFMICVFVFFFKQMTAYELRIRDWSSDVCASVLIGLGELQIDDEARSGLAAMGAAKAREALGETDGQRQARRVDDVVDGAAVLDGDRQSVV